MKGNLLKGKLKEKRSPTVFFHFSFLRFCKSSEMNVENFHPKLFVVSPFPQWTNLLAGKMAKLQLWHIQQKSKTLFREAREFLNLKRWSRRRSCFDNIFQAIYKLNLTILGFSDFMSSKHFFTEVINCLNFVLLCRILETK